MANRDKGINRGGASGMEGELGDESVDLNKRQEGAGTSQQKTPERRGGASQPRSPERRDGASQQQKPENVGRQVLDRGTDRLNDKDMDPDLPNDRSRSRPLGESGLDQGAQRGGLRREPDLEGAEGATGHETD